MAITLGGYTFDPRRTAVTEAHEETGGRDARVIGIEGLLQGFDTLAALEAELDAVLAAASGGGEEMPLSVRPGRVLHVRRVGFEREIARDARTASFKLDLEARNPFETAETETSVPWSIAAPGDTLPLMTEGNVAAPLVITITATGAVVNPGFSDGTRSIAYSGTIQDGETLVFDPAAGRAWLNGNDVTPYTTGFFPKADPAGATLTYTDDPASSHTAAATIAHRAHWW